MGISIIVAMSENRVIGKDNQIPWHISADLKRFKQLTTNNVVIMGRKTYESIGKALPNRDNFIISRQKNYSAPGCTVYESLNDAIEHVEKDKEIFIGGGEQVYRMAIDRADKIYMTVVHMETEGDTFFPEIDKELFSEISVEKVEGSPSYSYYVYERKT